MEDYRLEQTGQEVQDILNGAAKNTDLVAETERAEGAEGTLQDNIDAEALARQDADGLLQQGITDEELRAKAAEEQAEAKIVAIEGKIPSGASSENKLATEEYVDDSVATNTATYRGNYNLVSDLHLGVDATHEQIAFMLSGTIATADNNDYCFVQVPTSAETPTEIRVIERYKFNGEVWGFEYALNNSGYTAAQWAAINSGITSALVTKLGALPTAADLAAALLGKQDVLTFDSAPTQGSNNPAKSGGIWQMIDDEKGARINRDAELQAAIEAILVLIPSAATALNQLADKAFVNSSVATETATFRGTYNLVSDLHLSLDATHDQIAAALGNAISTADNNDYAFVQIPTSVDTPTEIRITERYKFNGTAWAYEYDLNNSGFTAAQWAAINSGITALLVSKLSGLPTATELATALAGKQAVLTFDNAPTQSSDNPVKSGGIYTAIKNETDARELSEQGLQQGISTNAGDISDIKDVLPSGATALNQLVDNDSMVAYVTTLISGISATFNVTSADGHITLHIAQVDGEITSVTLTTSDIASAAALNLKASQADLEALTSVVNTKAAQTDLTTLAGRVSVNETDISNLQAAYVGLTQSDIIVGALPASGVANKIYRVPGTSSYSDYMWNGSTFVLMATYNNAIDDEPTAGSNNLVKSSGVVQFAKNLLNAQHQTPIWFVDGKFVAVGNVGSHMNITFTDNAAYRCTVLSCRDNKLFYINGQGGDGPRLYAFLDSDNAVISKSNDSERCDGFLIAPENADKVIFNDYLKTGDFYVYKSNCNDDWIPVSSFADNQFVDVSGSIVDQSSFLSIPTSKNIIVNCENSGDYVIFTGFPYDFGKYTYGFLDKDFNVISRSEPTEECIGKKIKVPNNAVFFVGNFSKTRPMELYIRNNPLSLSVNKRHIVVAASNSSNWDKNTADFVCSGVHDEITITRAIDSLRKGGTVEFCDGSYEIQDYTNSYTDSVFGMLYCAIFISGSNDRHIVLKGRTRNKWYNSSYGAVFHFDMNNLDTSKHYVLIGGDPTVPAGDDLYTYTFHNNITIENLYMKCSRFDVPVIMVDLWNFGEAELNNLIIENDASIHERYTHQTISIPVKDSIAVRGLQHSKETMEFNNIVVHSFYYGMFIYGSDHSIMTDCMVARCVYGYWFKDLHKVATLINCCDEGNTYMPKFNGFGKISMIDFNVERFSYPEVQDAGDRRSECPDTWGGDISFVMQADADYDYSGSQFFRIGNGRNFDCVNMRIAKQGASLPSGNKFELYQKFFNTSTNKMMCWNGSEWV